MAAATDPQVLIARFAAAVLGVQLGRDAMAQALQAVAAQGAGAAADRLLAIAFAGMTAAEQARVVAHNLGLRPSNADAAEPPLAVMFDHAGAASGQALLTVLQGLADDTYKQLIDSSQTLLFNQRVEAALSYAEQRAGDAPFRSERSVTLTLDADVVQVGLRDDLVVNASRVAGASTWAAVDQIHASNHGLSSFVLQIDSEGGPMVLLAGLASYDELRIQAQPGSLAAPVQLDARWNDIPQRLSFQRSQVDVVVDPVPCSADTALRKTSIRLVDTAAGPNDHGVYFWGLADEPIDAAQLRLELMDTAAATSSVADERARPLMDQLYDGFNFYLNGERVDLKDELPGESARTSFNGAQTYDELLRAVQGLLQRADHLARWPALAQVTASLGDSFVAMDTRTGERATGTSIVLSVPDTSGLVLARGNFVADGGILDEGLHTAMAEAGFRRVEQPTAHIVLDHAGQGAAGGDLVLGASTQGEVSLASAPVAVGITRFEIEVQRDSALGVIAATDGQLQEVVVRNVVGNGGLKVQGWDQVTSVVGGAAADGDTAGLPGLGAAHGAWGFTDVRLLDLSGLRGPASIDAVLATSAHQRGALGRPSQSVARPRR